MPADELVDPWRSFLSEIDSRAAQELELHCIGGFAVRLRYHFNRPTGDIDVADARPPEAKRWLAEIAGSGSTLHKKHKVCMQIVTVARMPEDYESRLTQLWAGRFKRLRLFVPDPYDLALSKLTRNLDIDMEDVKHLARECQLDLDQLADRYRKELRPIIIGAPEWHDSTLRLWIDAIREERQKGR